MIVLKLWPEGEAKTTVEEIMKIQKEYDLNQDHTDLGKFWDFLNEHFNFGKPAYAFDEKASDDFKKLIIEQHKWQKTLRRENEKKRLEKRQWREAFNRQKSKPQVRFWKRGRAS